ncbi:MAG TPA: hypothetical protein VEW68_03235, partial [Patescibacteria group bacterium]|nr:hypothetical protein [Patescibacteria group bacterium]
MRPALILASILLLAGCGVIAPPGPSVSPGGSAAITASGPRISQPPVTPPTPPGTNLPAFACADASGGTPGLANTVMARVAEQTGFDRFVLQFDSTVPSYTVKRQANAVFQNGATGLKVTLLGNAGVLLTIHSATGATTFTGPTDFQHPEFQV